MKDFYLVTLETFAVQAVILLIIFWVLGKFLLKPYLKYLDEVETKEKAVLENHKNAESILLEAKSESERLLAEAKIKADKLLENGETLAKEKASKIVLDAENEGKALISSANLQIEKEKETALNDAKDSIVGLIGKFYTKLFSGKEIDKNFIESQLQNLNK